MGKTLLLGGLMDNEEEYVELYAGTAKALKDKLRKPNTSIMH